MRAYNRADCRPIRRHDGVRHPAHVVVLDPTLLAEGDVTEGLAPGGVLLVNAPHDRPVRRVAAHPGPVLWVDGDALAARAGARYANVVLLGALAAVLGDIPKEALEEAVRDLMGARLDEAALGATCRAMSLGRDAGEAFLRTPQTGSVPGERAGRAACARGGGQAGFVPFSLPGARVEPRLDARPRTGTWRTTARPVFDAERCVECLLCWAYCPDGAIRVANGWVVGIDYDLCKGCDICVGACPAGALKSVPEGAAGGMAHARR